MVDAPPYCQNTRRLAEILGYPTESLLHYLAAVSYRQVVSEKFMRPVGRM